MQGRGVQLERNSWNLVNSMIPLSGARRQLSKALTPYVYESRNELDRMLGAALPLYNQFNQAPRIDVFTGKPMENQNYAGAGVLSFMNSFLPFDITNVNTDPVLKSLSETGFDFRTEYADTLKGVELAPEDKQRLNELTAEAGLHSNLDGLFKADWWQKDYEAWREARDNGRAVAAKDSRWYEAITLEFQEARKEAVRLYQQENEPFRDKYDQIQQDKQSAGLGQYKRGVVENLANFPN